MRPRKLTSFWTCRHGHPMWRRPNGWICYTCNELNLRHAGEDKTNCKYGHRRVGVRGCSVCKAYAQTPWMKQLDATGHAVCPAGHRVSHHDDSVMYIKKGKVKARRCRQCLVTSASKARKRAPDRTLNPRCKSGLHERTPENTMYISGNRQCRPCWEIKHAETVARIGLRKQAKAGLKPSYVDWVVVERLLAKGQTEYLKRGTHRGPTDGERWVAYCTFVAQNGGRHPEDMYGEIGHDAMKLWKLSAWRSIGKKRNWREFTLNDLIYIMDTPEYVTGGFLLRWKKRESPRV